MASNILPLFHFTGFWLLANILNIKMKPSDQSKSPSTLCNLTTYHFIFSKMNISLGQNSVYLEK